MGITQYYTATSIDGYIADEHNSLDWLFQVPAGDDDVGHEELFAGFFRQVGAMAMGSTTYEWVLEYEQLLDHPEKWREYYGDTPCWVFSHRKLPAIPDADLRFVQGEAGPVHAEMVGSPATGTSGSSEAEISRVSWPTAGSSTRSN
jgi:dihydrofolate reductase